MSTTENIVWGTAAVICCAVGLANYVGGSSGKSEPAPVVAAQAAPPAEAFYLTPKGPTTIKSARAVACLGWVDMAFAEDRIKTGRCTILPVGTPVEVVDRMWLPETGVTNMVCIKPASSSESRCVWTYIDKLDVVAQ